MSYICLETRLQDKSSHSLQEGSQKQSTVSVSVFVSVTPRAALELLRDVATPQGSGGFTACM